MSENVEEYLKRIDEVIARGQFKDNWESLSQYREPQWYKNAKFGIFIHWGVYSVPAFGHGNGSDWYSRKMYIKDGPVYKHHVETYGEPKDFGYKDFVPLFKAEKFNPREWVRLFKDAGARYFMPVAEHHDGFQMYGSDLSEWNAVKMGPHRDVLGELKEAGEKEGLVFTASSHRAENYWFFCEGREFDSGFRDGVFQEPYGYAKKLFEVDQMGEAISVHGEGPCREHLEDWLARTCEIVDKYRPKIVWFDWWIEVKAFKPYLKKFAAYYYNRALEWGEEVAINYKTDAFAVGTAIFDVERGALSDIRPRLWQTDTSVAKRSWGYKEGNQYKTPESLVCDLVDIVSKNGCLLLNIGPKADGTIPREDREILLSIGGWLKVNGESIYDTDYWTVYGEGPEKIESGENHSEKDRDYSREDIRFTYKAPCVYANVLRWPEDGVINIRAMALAKKGKDSEGSPYFKGDIVGIEVLGHKEAKLSFAQSRRSLEVKVDKKISTTFPVCLKIEID